LSISRNSRETDSDPWNACVELSLLCLAFGAFYSGIRLQIYLILSCRGEPLMSVLPSLMRFVVLLICLSVVNGPAWAASALGTVTRVQNQAQIGATTAAVGAPGAYERPTTHRRQRPPAVTFRDGTVLTLGENAKVVVDRYVTIPNKAPAIWR
jgi:hypothetical protein